MLVPNPYLCTRVIRALFTPCHLWFRDKWESKVTIKIVSQWACRFNLAPWLLQTITATILKSRKFYISPIKLKYFVKPVTSGVLLNRTTTTDCKVIKTIITSIQSGLSLVGKNFIQIHLQNWLKKLLQETTD